MLFFLECLTKEEYVRLPDALTTSRQRKCISAMMPTCKHRQTESTLSSTKLLSMWWAMGEMSFKCPGLRLDQWWAHLDPVMWHGNFSFNGKIKSDILFFFSWVDAGP